MGTRGDGVIVFNQNGERIRSLTSLPTKGNLPNLRVISLARLITLRFGRFPLVGKEVKDLILSPF